MPRKPINYQMSCIYKICCKQDPNNNFVYYGTTTDLVKRRHQHKINCYNPKKKQYYNSVYQYIRDNGGWDNWEILKVKDFPCDTADEVRAEVFKEMTNN